MADNENQNGINSGNDLPDDVFDQTEATNTTDITEVDLKKTKLMNIL